MPIYDMIDADYYEQQNIMIIINISNEMNI